MRARAVYLGGRIHLRAVEGWRTLATSPLTLAGREGGRLLLFRFGAVVGVDATEGELDALAVAVRPRVEERDGAGSAAAEETAHISLGADDGTEGVGPDGDVRLRALDAGRVQVLAHVLAKSAVLGYYEERVAGVFDRVEGLAERLRDGGRPTSGRELRRQIGEALMIRTRMVGRVEVSEKPEIAWDEPDLDRLYQRLAEEYELADRDRALSRKLELISDVAGTYLELLDTRKSIRLEWYIVILILVEIVILLWEIVWRG